MLLLDWLLQLHCHKWWLTGTTLYTLCIPAVDMYNVLIRDSLYYLPTQFISDKNVQLYLDTERKCAENYSK